MILWAISYARQKLSQAGVRWVATFVDLRLIRGDHVEG